MTKAKKIRAFKEANPKATFDEIAKGCGVNRTYVYQVLHVAKKKIAKPITPTAGQHIVRDELNRLHAEIANLVILDEVNAGIIEQLKSDIIGYRAVISYLQGQLDGATV